MKYQRDNVTLYQGDALEVLRTLPDCSVQMCVTSPPYWGLRDYGNNGQLGLEKTPEEYVSKMVAIFREVRRVLRDDGTCWLNLGDSYASSPASGGPQLDNLKGPQNATPDSRKYIRPHGLKPKDLVGIPWRVAFALQADGWWLRQDIIWHKPNPMPESVTDRCTKAHEYMFLLTKKAKYFYDAEAVKEEAVVGCKDTDFMPVSVKDKAHAENNIQSCATGASMNNQTGKQITTRNKRSVWTIATQPFSEAHFAVFPPKLIEPCILAGSKPDDIVLDPFTGSGTTALVARQLGRGFVGIELSTEYCEMAWKRIKAEQDQGVLF